MGSITEFTGEGLEDAQLWLKRFDRFCLDRNLNGNPARKALYFETFMAGEAGEWYSTLAEPVKTDFDALVHAFLARFSGLAGPKETPDSRYETFANAVKTRKTVEDLRNQQSWRLWLAETLSLAI